MTQEHFLIDLLALVKTLSQCRFSPSITMIRIISCSGPFLFRAPVAATWTTTIVSIPLEKKNMTAVTEFILLGFQVGQNIRFLMFFLLLVIYCFTIFMNLLIIVLVSTSKNLRTPMYFFISQLSVSDILLTTDIVPKMLHILQHYRGYLHFTACLTQLYFFGATEAAECLLLTVMSYDRYVAICNPLRYTAIMTSTYCVTLSVTSWLAAFCFMVFLITTISILNFCGPNAIDHFFCDTGPLLELSCSDTLNVQLEIAFLSTSFILIPLIIIIASYAKIILSILRIPSNTGRQKAFSTCSSHLIVVSIFFWTLFGIYIAPTKGKTSTISKMVSLLYTVVTPLINPIIYSLNNNDIKKAVHNHIYRRLRV
ncbi:olfactory receptor 10A7-like [Hyla sarda]|uniref:olfactory receptor 10A7-like n=1 Tax=Hyla sarda TaxID=327740 RepID=UPI0024C45B13|nr:olfactory receptor 10A7-like [Hyla sarda]